MSELRIETGRLVKLNILLLFLVFVEPFLFNQLNSSSPLVENVSILYALDLGGLFVIQALLANRILSDKTRPDSIIQAYKLRRKHNDNQFCFLLYFRLAILLVFELTGKRGRYTFKNTLVDNSNVFAKHSTVMGAKIKQ